MKILSNRKYLHSRSYLILQQAQSLGICNNYHETILRFTSEAKVNLYDCTTTR